MIQDLVTNGSASAPAALFHADAVGVAHRNAGWIEILEAEHVDAEVLWRHALAMEWIDAARPAEEVARRLRMKPVLGERVGAGDQVESVLMHLDHQRVLAPADRAVARRQLREVRLDLEADGAAVTTAAQPLHRPRRRTTVAAHGESAAIAA